MTGQTFEIKLTLTTECSQTLNPGEVENWIYENFTGADVGQITVTEVEEVKE